MDPISKGFQDELHKLGFAIPPQVLSVGAPLALGAALSGLTLYDLIKSERLNEPIPSSAITGKGGGAEQVTARSWIKKILGEKPLIRPVVPITTERGIDTMLKDPKFGLLTRWYLKPFAKEVVTEGTNAAVIQGEDKDYVIIPAKVNPRVVEHEIGHLQDFARKLNEDPGLFRSVLSILWKPEYERNVLEKERRAWKYAQKTPLAEKAVKTYERGFHLGRASALGPLGAYGIIKGLSALMSAMKGTP